MNIKLLFHHMLNFFYFILKCIHPASHWLTLSPICTGPYPRVIAASYQRKFTQSCHSKCLPFWPEFSFITLSVLSFILTYLSFRCSPITNVHISPQALYSIPDVRTLRRQTYPFFRTPLHSISTLLVRHLLITSLIITFLLISKEEISPLYFDTNMFHFQHFIVP